MKTKTFFSGLSWLLLLNLLIKPAWNFLIDRQVQNAVGHEAYGVYFALFNLTYVLLFLADAGLTNFLTQSIAAGNSVNVRQLLRTKFFLLLLYAVACCFVAWITGIQQRTILFYLVLIQSLTSLFLFLRGLLTANQLYKTDALFSVLDKTLMLFLCLGPVYGFFARISIHLFLQLQLIATAVSVSFLLFLLVKKRLLASSAERQSVLRLLKSSAPFFLIVLLMATHYRLDGFLLERLHKDGARQAGIYAAAYRLLDAGNTVGYLCASFLVPFVARHRQETKRVENVVLLLRHVLLFIAIVAATFSFGFAPWLQAALYHTNDAFNSRVIALCVAVLPAYYLVHVYGSVLTAAAAFRPFIFSLLLAVAINIALNIILIPSLGALGCCIAALASQYSCALLLFLSASQKLSLRYGAKWFGLYTSCVVAFWLLFFLLKNYGNAVWIILVGACLLAIAFAFLQKARLQQLIATLNS